ncbi:hypothetical protein [Dyadobacter sp. CY312]|uniref:hypothetical protein n=1 Tax=Dyadobacter sp. CY312 TaxID=2907303 RepID=UPI001F29F22B|nr:hypothetical protein [Dyadobacter sp. CY312]MCE7041608.1 hypothetical protein [Dyadobacter sp. CY312]
MKLFRKILMPTLLILLLSNLPIISEILSVILYATVAPPFCFSTKDLKFEDCGGIDKIKLSADYATYKSQFPGADHTLYRVNREREWKYFFMWRIFLTDPNWKVPYMRDQHVNEDS